MKNLRYGTAAKIALMASVTCVLAFVSIPLPWSPVPVSGQSLGTMLAGTLLGPRDGALSMLVYLAVGSLGFPVFAGGRSGAATLIGPTGGYLWGFVLGAWIGGTIARFLVSRRLSHFWAYLAGNIIGGIAAVHLMGTLYLSFLTRRPLVQALAVGSIPFLPGDMVKAVAAAMLGQKLVPVVNREAAPGKP